LSFPQAKLDLFGIVRVAQFGGSNMGNNFGRVELGNRTMRQKLMLLGDINRLGVDDPSKPFAKVAGRLVDADVCLRQPRMLPL